MKGEWSCSSSKRGGQWVRRHRALALLASAVIHQTGGVELADATQTREALERGVGVSVRRGEILPLRGVLKGVVGAHGAW